jgi:hypothetical protein
MADNKSAPIDNLHTKNGNFICGVVEGNTESKYNSVQAVAFSYIEACVLIFTVQFSDLKHIPRLFICLNSLKQM